MYKRHSRHHHSTQNANNSDAKKQEASLLVEREAQIIALQKEVNQLTNQLSSVDGSSTGAPYYKVLGSQPTSSDNNSKLRKRGKKISAFNNIVQERESSISSLADDTGSGLVLKPQKSKRLMLQSERARMGRNASITTASVLNALPQDDDSDFLYRHAATHGWSTRVRTEMRQLTTRIMDMFRDPTSSRQISYLNSVGFATDLMRLFTRIMPILEEEPRCAFVSSPAYVFGDIHGNLEDLHFFSDNLWRLGIGLTAGNFVFLGDYVDRGRSCLEVVSYLLTLKLLFPHKICLLRGNHETRDVNGWEEHYGERSYLKQCRERFGDDTGYRVWELSNQVFDRLPLSAVIDQDIFCVHGGIPRPISTSVGDKPKSRIQDILAVPRIAGINPPYEHESESYQQVASDCIWSDPASDEQESCGTIDPSTGFGESLRGGGAICFGHRAVSQFLQQHNYSYIMRAHEAHAEGVAVSKGARVFTVFSTSQDHNQGREAMAGCVLVDTDKLRVINRSPAYGNQYVHKRDSISLSHLKETEIEQRMKLGLVTQNSIDEDEDDEDLDYDLEDGEGDEEECYNVEEWEDFDEDQQTNKSDTNSDGDDDSNSDSDSDEEPYESRYIIDTRRSSSVDPSQTSTNSPLSTSTVSNSNSNQHSIQATLSHDSQDSSRSVSSTTADITATNTNTRPNKHTHFDFRSQSQSQTQSSNTSNNINTSIFTNKNRNPFGRMSSVTELTEDDVEDSTVDGDEDDDEHTVIQNSSQVKHPKSKNPFLIPTQVLNNSRSNSPSKSQSQSQSKSPQNNHTNKKIEQKDSADSVMVWEDEDENVCPTNVEVSLAPLSPSKRSHHNSNGNGNELLVSTPVKEQMSPQSPGSANVSRRHHKVIAVRKQYSKASF